MDGFFNTWYFDPKHSVTKVTTIPDIDERPSMLPMRVVEQGRVMLFQLDVLGEGMMELVVESTLTGKLIYKGMKLCRGTK